MYHTNICIIITVHKYVPYIVVYYWLFLIEIHVVSSRPRVRTTETKKVKTRIKIPYMQFTTPHRVRLQPNEEKSPPQSFETLTAVPESG